MDDDEFSTQIVSRIFNQPHKHWDASNIRAIPDGHWLQFEDKISRKTLNSPRLRNLDLRIPYRHKPYEPDPVETPKNPLEIGVHDNYKDFLPRKVLYCSRKQQIASERSVVSTEIEDPGYQSKKYFMGEKNITRPFRKSVRIPPRSTRRSRTKRPAQPNTARDVSNARQTLFDRSLKIKKKEINWPPEEFYGYPIEQLVQ